VTRAALEEDVMPRINANEPNNVNQVRDNEPRRLQRLNTPTPQPSFSISNASNPFSGLSVEAALFEALELQKSGAEHDLLNIVDEMRANNGKKAEVRKLQGLLRQMEGLAGNKDKQPSADDAAKLDALKTQFQGILDANGLGGDTAVQKLFGGMPGSASTSKEDMAKWFGGVKDELDALSQNYSDMGEENNIKLQLALSKKSQFETALSNSMKSIDETAKGIVRNIG
jgi:hypothetical protein